MAIGIKNKTLEGNIISVVKRDARVIRVSSCSSCLEHVRDDHVDHGGVNISPGPLKVVLENGTRLLLWMTLVIVCTVVCMAWADPNDHFPVGISAGHATFSLTPQSSEMPSNQKKVPANPTQPKSISPLLKHVTPASVPPVNCCRPISRRQRSSDGIPAIHARPRGCVPNDMVRQCVSDECCSALELLGPGL